MIRLEEVIITDMARRGDGNDDPIRTILQVYNKDGQLIAENDHYQKSYEAIYRLAKEINAAYGINYHNDKELEEKVTNKIALDIANFFEIAF